MARAVLPEWLEPYGLRTGRSPGPRPLFEEPGAEALDALRHLYVKYGPELQGLALQLRSLHREMRARGEGAMFCDFEGEVLYMLVRETAPGVVYDISPHCGYSTNYLLAAVSRNQHGVVHGFELAEEFAGRPVEEVVRGNLLPACDPARYQLHVGDARRLVTRRLSEERPGFVLLDSCHEDYFAEFYVKILFPRLDGPAFVQDVAHGDPRPEPSGEALYLLSFLHASGTGFLPLGALEDALTRERSALVPRRPQRSSSIVVVGRGPEAAPGWTDRALALQRLLDSRPLPGDAAIFPAHARTARMPRVEADDQSAAMSAPEDDYLQPPRSRQPGRAATITLAELTALRRAPPSDLAAWTSVLLDAVPRMDAWCRLAVVDLFDGWDQARSADGLAHGIDLASTRGAEIPLRLARRERMRGRPNEAAELLGLAGARARDPALALGYRHLLSCAEEHIALGNHAAAREAVLASILHLAPREPMDRSKGATEILAFVLRHPSFLAPAFAAGLEVEGNQVPTAARLAASAAARRVLRSPFRRVSPRAVGGLR